MDERDILDALDLIPSEFDDAVPIEAARVLQELYWRRKREWIEFENACAVALNALVAEGVGAGRPERS